MWKFYLNLWLYKYIWNKKLKPVLRNREKKTVIPQLTGPKALPNRPEAGCQQHPQLPNFSDWWGFQSEKGGIPSDTLTVFSPYYSGILHNSRKWKKIVHPVIRIRALILKD